MNPYIEIAGRKIGIDFPPLVIAEIGINHEGSLAIAKQMVDAAKRAGVEMIKHQTHIVEDEMSGAAKNVIPGNAEVSIYEIMERCSLNEADESELKKYVESKGIIFISTPFSRAGAIVGSLKNILVAHIEGGELSGTVDELIRHSVSKLTHIHFVSNSDAAKRLVQMGEIKSSVFSIGSPDVDIMFSENLPTLETVMKHYDITFDDFAIVVFHPVTTEAREMKNNVAAFVDALENDYHNYIIVFPNNDLGSQFIIQAYEKLKNNKRFNIFPSLRFEYFLTLLKNAKFIIGNSSAGIREAPYYGIPIINIGSRQQNRTINADIINVDYNYNAIFEALKNIDAHPVDNRNVDFGAGNSAELFIETLKNKNVWKINHQKQFRDS